MNRVIAVVGMCGSGKSELTGMFRADGYDSIHFGDVTMNEMKRRGVEIDEIGEMWHGYRERDEEAMDSPYK